MTVTPTTFDSAFGPLANDMIAESGRSLLLRQPTRVETQSGANAGEVVSSPLSSASLTLDGDHLAGVTVIDLSAASITGLLVAGDSLTVGGVAYTVSGGPYAVATAAIANVTITPALAANASNGAAVTADFSGTFTPIKGVVTQASKRLLDSGVAEVGDFEILVSRVALEALGVMIDEGDELHFGATVSDRLAVIEKVLPIASGELDAAFTVVARLR